MTLLVHKTRVIRLSGYVDQYQRHPEAKAADAMGEPAGEDTVGYLGRLRLQSRKLRRLGKEVDRLGGDEGVSLVPDRPVEYERHDLAEDIAYLAQFPQASTATDLGLTERGWRKLIKTRPKPHAVTAQHIREVAERYRLRHNIKK